MVSKLDGALEEMHFAVRGNVHGVAGANDELVRVQRLDAVIAGFLGATQPGEDAQREQEEADATMRLGQHDLENTPFSFRIAGQGEPQAVTAQADPDRGRFPVETYSVHLELDLE
jgi:hypothetical protein